MIFFDKNIITPTICPKKEHVVRRCLIFIQKEKQDSSKLSNKRKKR